MKKMGAQLPKKNSTVITQLDAWLIVKSGINNHPQAYRLLGVGYNEMAFFQTVRFFISM